VKRDGSIKTTIDLAALSINATHRVAFSYELSVQGNAAPDQ